tara:strand:- start:581 stop:754 length:174 start_codon:yes stop_codon:yes gene_type:complete
MITISELKIILVYIAAFGLSDVIISRFKLNKAYYYIAILLIAYTLYIIQKKKEDKIK